MEKDQLLFRISELTGHGKIDAARDLARRLVKAYPDEPQGLYVLGYICLREGKPAEAADWLEAALKKQAGLVPARLALGDARLRLQEFAAARAAYAMAIKADPKRHEGYLGLGRAHRRLGAHRDAAAAFRRALERKPGHEPLMWLLAEASLDAGDAAAAAEIARAARDTNPRSHDAWALLGRISQAQGNLDDAARQYQQAMAIEPGNTTAFRGLVEIHAGADLVPYLSCQETKFNNPLTARPERVKIGFALGQAHEKLKNYDDAFHYFKHSNAMKKEKANYDGKAHSEFTNSIMQLLNPGFIERHKGLGSSDDTPIFVIGLPRSGSTLVEHILSSHPDVAAAGETNVMHEILRDDLVLGRTDGRQDAPLTVTNLDQCAEKYVKTLRLIAPDAKHIINKNLTHFKNLGMIHLMFPKARLIHCVRGAMDTCFSIYKHHFSGDHPYAYDLDDIAAYYRDYRVLMDYWERSFLESIVTVEYETLATNPRDSIRNLLDACDLDHAPKCFEPHNNTRTVLTASNTQVRKPVYSTSIDLWKNYEKHLGSLREALDGIETYYTKGHGD